MKHTDKVGEVFRVYFTQYSTLFCEKTKTKSRSSFLAGNELNGMHITFIINYCIIIIIMIKSNNCDAILK